MATKKKAVKPVRKELRGTSIKVPTQQDINSRINTAIQSFMKSTNKLAYQNSYNLLIPVATECLKRLDKNKFKKTGLDPAFWGIKRLAQIQKLFAAMENTLLSGDTKYLHEGIYFFIKWFNQNK